MPQQSPAIVHLTPFPAGADPLPPPGVPSYMARLVPALAAAGVARQVVVAERGHRPAAAPERPHPSVEVARAYVPGIRFGGVGRRLAATPGEVLHAQHEVFLYGGPAAAMQFPRVLRAARRRRPAVVTVHGVVDLARIDRGFVTANGSRVPPAAARAMLRRLIGGAARAGDAVIVHEEVLAERLLAQYGIPADRVCVIPHPVPDPVPVARDVAREAYGCTRPTALFFGFVTGYKGLPLLLEGWERYRAGGGEGELVVAGGRHPRLAGQPAYERGYAAMMARAQAIGGVRWEGYVADRDVPSLLSAVDALVLPYRDGLAASGPMSFAVAYGLPVLASEALAGAAPHPGGVFRGEPEALAERLRAVLDTPLAGELAEASRRLARERSLERMAERTVELYRRLGA